MGFASVDTETLEIKVEALIDEIRANAGSVKDDDRYRLSEAAKKLSMALEMPGDSIYRIVQASLQMYMASIGLDTKLFEILAENEGTATNAELAEKTKISPALLKRILRFYQAYGMISQPGDDAYGATNITRALTTPLAQRSFGQFTDVVTPACSAMQQFLRETKYVDPTSNGYIPWNIGHNTSDSFWVWMEKHPAQMDGFLALMRNHRVSLRSPFDVIDFEQELAQGATDSTPLFVDIGGAMGHQCIALKKKYPGITGRIILQEQQEVVERVQKSPLPGWENMEAEAHSMWEPQTIKGARGYYMRNILHDYPTHKAVELLQNIRPAMTNESKVLLDEMVLPERGSTWNAAGQDITMLACFGARERTLAEWAALIDQAGLKILKVSEYSTQRSDSIIMAILK